MTLGFKAGRALDAQEAVPDLFGDGRPSNFESPVCILRPSAATLLESAAPEVSGAFERRASRPRRRGRAAQVYFQDSLPSMGTGTLLRAAESHLSR